MEAIRELEDELFEELFVADPEAGSRYVIDNDEKAEKTLCRIRSHIEERDRIVATCMACERQYQQRREKAIRDAERETSYLSSLLEAYFETVTKKATKTPETYALPSGKLKRKFAAQKIEHDDAMLMQAYPAYVQQKPTLAWGELKKRLAIQGGVVLDTETGEIVAGASVLNVPAVFTVEV